MIQGEAGLHAEPAISRPKNLGYDKVRKRFGANQAMIQGKAGCVPRPLYQGRKILAMTKCVSGLERTKR